ncbi:MULTISPECIES: toxic anion resistance protein [Aneurinibacillus]|uniref:Toxic anion resistance protein n=1 Tax=Aneurinibacillus thermoaerophilus TaxID=143495 RepID=A0A1G8F747_ANETH|nr:MULTISPECIES: toxic anion resistance protein [Aneurinibacillus]AMA71534.1 hypothetical protein ACH33_00915 [Aneurinibacillus sp. XH2]MED0675175.1 toxic anion resistance protein [Aneurinibacillus thermoaerophilus]MED0677739.1 toxic anion resistance protein [Aneurinibacillus thermoaerophilus]MED0735732.1 toxic anion resistance protein [Aneurinibacillus thermoaerophilus]MED0758550.1 toxic anion resistance protein [Aneurinibacillus thermoaerophilus]
MRQLNLYPSVPAEASFGVNPASLDSLSPQQQIQVKELMFYLTPTKPHVLTQYGAEVQQKMAELADNMLNQVRIQRVEEQIGAILRNLLAKIKEVQPDKLFEEKRGFLNRLFNGSVVKSKERLLVQYQKANYEIERMADMLERLRHQMLRDSTMLEVLYERSREYFNELNIYIVAAREKLKELQQYTLPNLRSKLEAEVAEGDPLKMQELIDMERFADRLEKKLQDLLISQTVALQTAPQIRLIQENYEMLMEKIQSSILTTIPLWKSQMVILLSLVRQRDVLAVQRQAVSASGTLLKQTSAALKEADREISQEQELMIAELEAFKETQRGLLAVVEETLHMQQEGSAKRRQIEQDMDVKPIRSGNTV